MRGRRVIVYPARATSEFGFDGAGVGLEWEGKIGWQRETMVANTDLSLNRIGFHHTVTIDHTNP